MPVSKAESNRRYLERQIKKHGSQEAYKAYLAQKKRESRAKKNTESIEPVIPSGGIEELAKQLAQLSARLSQPNITQNEVNTIIHYVEAVKPHVERIDSKQVKDLSEAVFTCKCKSIKNYKLKTHTALMKKIEYLGKKIDPNWTFELFKNTERVLKFIDSNWSNKNTKQAYLQALAGITRYIEGFESAYKIYSETSIKNRKQLTHEQNKLEKSKKEGELWVDWSELEVASENKALNSKERAMIALYTLIPPRRLSLIKYLVRGSGTDMKYNYLDGNKIVLNNYKTCTKYGTYTIELPERLQKIMSEYITEYNIKIGDIVFPNSKGKVYSNYISTVLSKTFQKSVGKPITQQILRHSYVSHRMKQPLNLNDKISIARELGHSISMFERYNRITP